MSELEPSPQIRELAEADLEPLCAALCELPLLLRYDHTPVRLAEALRRARERHERLLIAESDRLLGLAWFSTAGTLGMGGYLRLIAVVDSAKGIGARLLAAFEQEVFAESAHAFLLVSDFNDGAQRFYERHGYVRVGALPGLVLSGVTEFIYWKARPTRS